MSKFSKIASLALFLTIGALLTNAEAAPVTIHGFVTDLTGVPHQRPKIRITVRSVRSGQVIATGDSKPDGSFSIPIDPNTIPEEDIRLSMTAQGTAFINGVETPVRTNGTLYGLAGVVDSKFKTLIPGSTNFQFILLVVPKEDSECTTTPNCRCRRIRLMR